jgi:hypothetical protein
MKLRCPGGTLTFGSAGLHGLGDLQQAIEDRICRRASDYLPHDIEGVGIQVGVGPDGADTALRMFTPVNDRGGERAF